MKDNRGSKAHSKAKPPKKPESEAAIGNDTSQVGFAPGAGAMAGAAAGLLLGLLIEQIVGGAAGTWVEPALGSILGVLVGGALGYRLIKPGQNWRWRLLALVALEVLTISLLLAGLTRLLYGFQQAGETYLTCRRLETLLLVCQSETWGWLGLAVQNEETFRAELVTVYSLLDQEGHVIEAGPLVLAGDTRRAMMRRFSPDIMAQIDTFIWAAEPSLTIKQSHWVESVPVWITGSFLLLIDGLILWLILR